MSDPINLDPQIEISRWLDEYGDDMYSWAVYKTSSKETAEDLVQDTMLSAFKSFEKFKPGSNPKTWLFTILNNKIIDYYRASNTTKSVNQTQLLGAKLEDDNFNADGIWNNSPVSMWANDEEHLLDNTAFLNILNNCIEALPNNWKSVIVSKYIDHKKGKEICQELGITPSNLWQMAHRAKLQLKGCLDSNWKNDR
jgi:RNA polymerase sigma-70 factor (TIGR02943 family)